MTSLANAYIPSKSLKDRNENEYYPTPPIATLSLLKNSDVPKSIWEPAAGRGHISKELIRNGHEVISTDLYAYENSLVPIETGVDFLTAASRNVKGVITNPPFRSNLPEKLIRRLLDYKTIQNFEFGYDYVALFARLTFMESARRHNLFKEIPPTMVMAFSERIQCSERYFDINHGLGGMVAYAWFVWDYRYEYGREMRDTGTRLIWIKPSDYIGDLEH